MRSRNRHSRQFRPLSSFMRESFEQRLPEQNVRVSDIRLGVFLDFLGVTDKDVRETRVLLYSVCHRQRYRHCHHRYHHQPITFIIFIYQHSSPRYRQSFTMCYHC